MSSDGCSNLCTIETGWFCGGFPSVCSSCGDSKVMVAGGEVCDDGTNDGIECATGC